MRTEHIQLFGLEVILVRIKNHNLRASPRLTGCRCLPDKRVVDENCYPALSVTPKSRDWVSWSRCKASLWSWYTILPRSRITASPANERAKSAFNRISLNIRKLMVDIDCKNAGQKCLHGIQIVQLMREAKKELA